MRYKAKLFLSFNADSDEEASNTIDHLAARMAALMNSAMETSAVMALNGANLSADDAQPELVDWED